MEQPEKEKKLEEQNHRYDDGFDSLSYCFSIVSTEPLVTCSSPAWPSSGDGEHRQVGRRQPSAAGTMIVQRPRALRRQRQGAQEQDHHNNHHA
jgi:hypothetical protein